MVVKVIHLLLKWSLFGVDIRSFSGGVDLVYNMIFFGKCSTQKRCSQAILVSWSVRLVLIGRLILCHLAAGEVKGWQGKLKGGMYIYIYLQSTYWLRICRLFTRYTKSLLYSLPATYQVWARIIPKEKFPHVVGGVVSDMFHSPWCQLTWQKHWSPIIYR